MQEEKGEGMVDDFMVCVDRIIASACFEAVNEQGYSNNGGNDNSRVGRGVEGEENRCGNGEGSSKKNKMGEMIECRICQEEDEEQAMEAPCACNGTLKWASESFMKGVVKRHLQLCTHLFAHRRCIQRWCNKKGDITCEICNQVYSPNYALPPARPTSDGMAIDIRQSWGPHINLHDPRILALAAAEHRLLQVEYEDYAAVNSGESEEKTGLNSNQRSSAIAQCTAEARQLSDHLLLSASCIQNQCTMLTGGLQHV
ncbi:hypothetical protein ACLOJK_011823 [Asimina triloba]